MEQAIVYTVNRWDCPACDFVNENDADFEPIEECEHCDTRVELSI